jgi:hypothetical protein
MAKMPAFQFYPGDWRRDPGVNALNRHDRSVWFDILCIMHESEERGVLLLAGKPMPEEALGRLLSVDVESLRQSLSTIAAYGVSSTREDGALFCRRMVRDEEKRQIQAEDGKRGGNPALCENYNVPGFVYAVQRASDGAVKIGISVNPSKRLYKLRYENKLDSLEMLSTMHTQDMGATESALHKRYAHCGSGEWFSLSGEELGELLSTLKGKDKGRETPSSSSSSSELKATTHFVLPDWIDPKLWKDYEEMRRRLKKPMTDKTRELAISKLEALRKTGDTPTDVLNQSILNSWQGLFEVNKGKSVPEPPKRVYIA